MPDRLNNVSAEAVAKATGKTWDEWIKALDKAGAKAWDHKATASYLYDKQKVKPWWSQMVTVGYEKHHNKRTTGEAAGAGFEIGVQKTFTITADKAWKLITSPAGLKLWLGDNGDFKPLAGYGYRTKEGVSGEIRTVDVGKRLRLTWKLPAQRQFSTLQIYLLPTGGKTAIHFHQEKLAGPKEREIMRKHWQTVLSALQKEV